MVHGRTKREGDTYANRYTNEQRLYLNAKNSNNMKEWLKKT